MRIWKAAILAGLLMPSAALAGDTFMAEMQTLERARNAAIAADDEAALADIYAADFEGTTASGAQMNRGDMFAMFARNHQRGGVIAESTIMSARRITDTVAVVTGRLKLFTPDKHELVSDSYYTHVFRKDGNAWHLVAGAGTPNPKK